MKKILINNGDEIVISDNADEKLKTRIQVFTVSKNRASFSVKAAKKLKIFRHDFCNETKATNKLIPNEKNSQMKILVVEDDPVAQMIIQSNLAEFDCTLDIASTGQKAEELFNDSYDLVLLDIGLPDMSGLDVCKMIRKKQTRHIPILIATAHGDGMREESLAAGADVFMTKPYKMEIIKNYLKKIS